jgi:hypothetical protein
LFLATAYVLHGWVQFLAPRCRFVARLKPQLVLISHIAEEGCTLFVGSREQDARR